MGWQPVSENRWEWETPKVGGDPNPPRHLLLAGAHQFVELHGDVVHFYDKPEEIDPERPLDSGGCTGTVDESGLGKIPDDQIWDKLSTFTES